MKIDNKLIRRIVFFNWITEKIRVNINSLKENVVKQEDFEIEVNFANYFVNEVKIYFFYFNKLNNLVKLNEENKPQVDFLLEEQITEDDSRHRIFKNVQVVVFGLHLIDVNFIDTNDLFYLKRKSKIKR